MKLKRLFAMAMSAVMTMSCFSALNVNAEEIIFENPILKTMDYKITPDGKYIYNILDDGNIEIVRYTGRNSPVKIPSEIDGKTVTTIGYMNIDADGTLCGGINSGNVVGAFEDCSAFDIEIPDTITKIDDYAFAYSKLLYDIKFSKNLTEIGEFAFYKCENLKELVLPNKLKKIDAYAFGDCENLKDVTIPKSVEDMDACEIGFTDTFICGPKDYSEKIDGVQINCYKGTAGEKYAKENGLNYEYLDAPAHEHRYVSKIIKKPTYTSTGIETYTCSKCKSFSSYVIPKLKLNEVSNLKTSSITTNSIKLSWNKVKDAKGYEVYQNGKKIKTITGTSYTVSKIKAGTTYKFNIKPYTKSGNKTVYGNKSITLTTTTKAKAVSLKVAAGKKKVALKWGKVTGATNYKVYYKTSSKGKWKLLKTVSNKTTSYSKTKLLSKKTYWFKVDTVRKVSGKTYTTTGSTKSVKIK